ncbi:hypothetical protein [Streptomyces sp. NPDC057740]|uniref:hypothetical protein n=1 Tax=Streptomyces sp. NPDC057740 TaxID=3346234 RepID=UPI003698B21F
MTLPVPVQVSDWALPPMVRLVVLPESSYSYVDCRSPVGVFSMILVTWCGPSPRAPAVPYS